MLQHRRPSNLMSQTIEVVFQKKKQVYDFGSTLRRCLIKCGQMPCCKTKALYRVWLYDETDTVIFIQYRNQDLPETGGDSM